MCRNRGGFVRRSLQWPCLKDSRARANTIADVDNPGLPADLDDQIKRALEEDLGKEGDITSNAVVPADAACAATAISREEGVLAGLAVFKRVFELVDVSV